MATTNFDQIAVAGPITTSGLTGSVAASRYVGATATGAPTTGAHLVGDFVIAQDGALWVCTVAGTPGTWAQAATALAGAQAITSASANALAVGRQGTTAPQFNVDASTATVATGLEIKGAAAAGGVAVRAISSGTDENLAVDAKGAGTLTLNGTATGGVTVARAATLSKTLVYTPAVVSVLAIDVTAGVVHTKSIAADSTFTASAGGTAGQRLILMISTDGTQRVATFGTNLKSSGTMTIPANKVGCISFVSDGSNFYETGRAVNT